ncbi:O-antigen ligase family protein [Paenibacillus solani]|uniref:Polymerase n=1 Tax=Paenibacillus solani TaxID=1705565 RepID=A0A0M1NJ16_9BACL|nr:O-antigen ligase family protein [Paenibacillus solani]KOR82102.1 polymerase [Paenibacillus solani]
MDQKILYRYGGMMLIALVLVAAMRSGMFFAGDVYGMGMGFGLLLLIMITMEWFLHKLQNRKMHSTASTSWPGWILLDDKRLRMLIGCICGMMLLYGLHGIGEPLSLAGTMKEIIRWGSYGSFAVIAWRICRTAEGLRMMQAGWHLMGAVLCGSALLAVYGLFALPYGIYLTADANISATGARLGGLLQYPNTFGAVMAAFLLERLFALPSVLRNRTGTLRAAAALLPLLPYTAALLLTESRGAWLAAAIACAAGFAKERHAIAPLLVVAAAPVASAALLYRQLAEARLAPALLPGLLWLAGLWAGGVLAGPLLCRWRHSGSPGRGYAAPGAVGAAALLAAAAGAMILHQVQDRALGGAATLSARRLLYSDAWQLARSSLWLGRGGETWRQSYLAIQSQPYVGAEVHSGYMNILLDTGVIGLLLVLVLISMMITRLLAVNSPLLPAALVLIGHAAVDFDWSFGLVWLLLLWLVVLGLASSSSGREAQAGPHHRPHKSRRGEWPTLVKRRLAVYARKRRDRSFMSWLSLRGLALLLLTSWVLLAAALAISEDEARLAVSQPVERQIALLRSSLKWNPANTEAALRLANWLPPSQRIPLLMNSMTYSPDHPGLSWKLAEAYSLRGAPQEAAAWYQRAIDRDRFNTVKQTRAVLKLTSLAKWHRTAGELAHAEEAARSGLELLERYRSLATSLSETDLHRNDRGFELSSLAVRQAGRLVEMLEGRDAIRRRHP